MELEMEHVHDRTDYDKIVRNFKKMESEDDFEFLVTSDGYDKALFEMLKNSSEGHKHEVDGEPHVLALGRLTDFLHGRVLDNLYRLDNQSHLVWQAIEEFCDLPRWKDLTRDDKKRMTKDAFDNENININGITRDEIKAFYKDARKVWKILVKHGAEPMLFDYDEWDRKPSKVFKRAKDELLALRGTKSGDW